MNEIQQECMLFSGTTVVNGSGMAVVTGIGAGTEIGKIHQQIEEARYFFSTVIFFGPFFFIFFLFV